MEAYAKQLQQELETKQSQLSKTESALDEIRQQSENDKQEKAQQQATLNKLQQEMQEAEAEARAQQEKMAKLDAERKEEQQRLQKALQAKHYLMPYPLPEMQNNPNLTPQNPGY